MGKNETRKYETIIVLDADLGEAGVKDEIAKVAQLLTDNGAKSVVQQNWGRRQVAYTLQCNKKNTGYYVCFEYETDNHGIVDIVARVLRINEKVAKFQQHRRDIKVRKVKPSAYSDSFGSEYEDEAVL